MKSKFIIFAMIIALLAGCGGGQKSEEKLALEYINNFVNATDKDTKAKFVSEKIHPDIKKLFELLQSQVLSEDQMYKNPRAVESIDNENDGKKGSAVLIQADKSGGGTKEMIILVVDNKIALGFPSDNEQFKQFRSKFKTELPK